MCKLSNSKKKDIHEQWECIKLASLMKMTGMKVREENKTEAKLNTSVLKPIFYSLNELNPA